MGVVEREFPAEPEENVPRETRRRPRAPRHQRLQRRMRPSNDKDTRTLLGALAALGYVMVAPDSIGLRAFGATGFPPYLVG